MPFPDVDAIGQSLATLIETNVTDFKSVKYEGDLVEDHFVEMPLCEVILDEVSPEVTAGRDYYVTMVFGLEISAFDLSRRSEAATVRNDLWKSVAELIADNPRFHGDIETAIAGRTDFASAADEEQGAFVAGARMEVIVTAFANRS